MAEAKKFEEMTKEEKDAAFEKWAKGRDTRKGQSKAKKTATKQLIAVHLQEFNKLLKAAGGVVK